MEPLEDTYVMAQPCRRCDEKNLHLLVVVQRSGIAPGRPGHDVDYSHVLVYSCLACGSGLVEVVLHDCWEWREPWDSWNWYQLQPAEAAELASIVEACPAAADPRCRCPVHVALRISCRDLKVSAPDGYGPWVPAFDDPAYLHAARLDVTYGPAAGEGVEKLPVIVKVPASFAAAAPTGES